MSGGFSGGESEKKHDYIKYAVIIVIILIVLWYLDSQRIIDIPFF